MKTYIVRIVATSGCIIANMNWSGVYAKLNFWKPCNSKAMMGLYVSLCTSLEASQFKSYDGSIRSVYILMHFSGSLAIQKLQLLD